MLGFECSGNPPCYSFRCAPERVVVEMGVAGSSRDLSVTQQPPDDWQTQTTTGTDTGLRVSQIVQADAGQAGPTGDGIPRAL